MDTKKSLRMALAIRNMKKNELAKRVGCSDVHIYNQCKSGIGKTEMLEKIAHALDMSASEFIKLGE